ncbi:MAG: HD-GYP domain-containing protein [Treponema sp.]|nr:HD-GYP domain-containing protein [Treponema sp.]
MGNDSVKKEISPIPEETELCGSLFEFTKYLFDKNIKIEERLVIQTIYDHIKRIVKNIRNGHSNLLLALHESDNLGDANYLYAHTVRTTIIALIIGKYLKMPTHKLVELGISGLLHDIGMLSVPPELYLGSHPLSDDEKAIINHHPVYGYKILDTYNFPHAIKTAILQHHEREDGTGYPLKLDKTAISQCGKIIAVACSYEAITAQRNYRETGDLHEGILTIMKNKGKYYEAAVAALVNSLSVFPVGLYVLLSDGAKGKVININPYSPRFPVVHILNEKTSTGRIVTRQTSADGLYIVRPLKADER